MVKREPILPTAEEAPSAELAGLEVTIRWLNGKRLVLEVRQDGQAVESYAPACVDMALAAAGHLIRGSQPPRDLFRRDKPAR
jgi:hypothetical protein